MIYNGRIALFYLRIIWKFFKTVYVYCFTRMGRIVSFIAYKPSSINVNRRLTRNYFCKIGSKLARNEKISALYKNSFKIRHIM